MAGSVTGKLEHATKAKLKEHHPEQYAYDSGVRCEVWNEHRFERVDGDQRGPCGTP